MKALVTGGAGFIGAALSQALAADGASVDIVDDFSRGARDAALEALAARPGVRVIAADLRRPDALAGADADYDCVFHLAAIVGVANVAARPYAVLRDNLQMTIAALDAAARMKRLGRFVFLSTSEVYAGSLEHLDLPFPTPEDTPLALPDIGRPRTSYMLSKIYGEALCRQSGLPCTIVRPHNVYGPRMGLAHVVPELMARILALPSGGALDVHSPEHARTFCYIDDAVEMIRRLAVAGDGGVFNVGTERPEVRIADLAERIVALVGRDVRTTAGATTAGSPSRRCPDMSRTRAATGYASTVSLDDGLARTWAWYRPNVFGLGKETVA